jgi:hypothetical protein
VLIDEISANYLLADRGYDTNKIVKWAVEYKMISVISPKENLLKQREYDSHLYKSRHLVENAFLALKKMTWHSHSLCEKYCIIPCRCAYSLLGLVV